MIKKIIDGRFFSYNGNAVFSAPISAEKDRKMNVAIIIDTAIAVPPTTGVTYRLYYISRELAARGHKIVWVLGNRNFQTASDLNELCQAGIRVHLLPPSLFYNAGYISEILVREKIDIVQYEITQTFISLGARIMRKTRLPAVLELHDVEAMLVDVFGREEDGALMSFLQYAAGEYADAIITMTSLDYKLLVRQTGIQAQKLFLAPNGVMANRFDGVKTEKSKNTLLFLGNLFYPPNRDAFIYIADKILPVLNKDKKVLLKSVGMIPPGLKKQYSSRDNVNILGEVKNETQFIRELKSSTLGLCAVFAGSGMKVKILDYCLAGLPVVSTPIGASGYERIKTIVVAKSKNGIIQAIRRFLNNSRLAEKTGRANRKEIIKLFGWPAVAEKVEAAWRLAYANRRERWRKERFQPLWLMEKRHVKNTLDSHFIIDKNSVRKYGK